jgi:predicted transposase YbfD/YdcC
MRKERHKKMILSKKMNNRYLRNKISLNTQIKNYFGYVKDFTLNPEE